MVGKLDQLEHQPPANKFALFFCFLHNAIPQKASHILIILFDQHHIGVAEVADYKHGCF